MFPTHFLSDGPFTFSGQSYPTNLANFGVTLAAQDAILAMIKKGLEVDNHNAIPKIAWSQLSIMMLNKMVEGAF